MSRFDMKGEWDARAREDSLFAIACDSGKNETTFKESGRVDAARLLEGLAPLLSSRESVLEIGCGVGRLLEAIASEFHHLYGVDVSGEMIRQGQARLTHLAHIHVSEIEGNGRLPFAESTFDFCFSYITFHHIPQKDVVIRYIMEAHRVLKPRGIFRFHLFGRREGALHAVRELLTNKSTWRGCKFTLPEILSVTRQAQFEVVEARYLDPSPERRVPLFGKSPAHCIWVTARKPEVPPVSTP
jgi:SAM-dependent methyltransferase